MDFNVYILIVVSIISVLLYLVNERINSMLKAIQAIENGLDYQAKWNSAAIKNINTIHDLVNKKLPTSIFTTN